MKIIFTGTPIFALPTMKVLLNSHHKICAVYTQPDRPAGRGKKLTMSPVKDFAMANDLTIYQPISLKDPEAQKELQNLQADILVNVAYGLLLPKTILNATKYGCINIHPSLLPRWRGAAPIQRAILAGDKITAVTIIKMDIGLDTGDIYKQVMLPIEGNDTSATLMKKTATLGAKLLLKVVNEIENGTATSIPQNDSQTTYANKLTKDEAKIDWNKTTQEIDCMIRAFNPWPVAYTKIDNQYIKVWEATIANLPKSNSQPPGTIISADDEICIATIDGSICLQKIQLSGKNISSTHEILNAYKKLFEAGKKFL